jgi:hypothetical protein
MTGERLTRNGYLEQIDAAHAAWEALLAEADDELAERPGVTGDWTLRDVAAHLNAWRSLTLERLAAAGRGETPGFPWPTGMSEESPAGVDEINRWMTERDRGLPTPAVFAESNAQLLQMRAAVEALSDADLLEPGRFAWLGGLPLSAVLDGSLEHLEEHMAEIRAWRATEAGHGG